MDAMHSSVDIVTLSAWRGQLAATGARRGLRLQLLHHHRALLPRFAAVYRQLLALPRRVRKALQRRWGASVAGIALLLTLQPLTSEAANFTVGTATELVAAINAANSNGEANTITLMADITLDAVNNTTYGPTGLPVVSSALTIAGNGHAIRREVSDPDQFRLLAINETGELTVQDTTLSGGSAAGEAAPGNQGGGLFTRSGQVTLVGCTVSGNTAESGGGGIYSAIGYSGLFPDVTVTLTNSTVANNAARFGGGVSLYGGTASLTNSTVSGNTASYDGGGVFGNDGGIFRETVTLLKSTVSGNSSGGDGGGVFGGGFRSAVRVTITDSTVVNNTALRYGGGLFNNTDDSVTLTNSTVSGNTAGQDGGGVVTWGYPAMTITKSTVSGNTAGRDGGGVFARFNAFNGLTLSNSTVSGNTAGRNGGGVVNKYGLVTLANSTVSGNRALGAGGGIEHEPLSDILYYTGFLTLGRTLIAGNMAPVGAELVVQGQPGPLQRPTTTLTLFGHSGLTTAQAWVNFTPSSTDLTATADGTTPTLLSAILDSSLANNGGPTLTHNLVAGSPAIDAAGATCDLTTDQRGAPRPVDGNGDGVAACDIGAVEFGTFPSALDCSTATASVNFPRLGNRHRYPVTIQGVTAPPDDTISLTINSIFQDEPVINPTGKTCPDGIGVGTAVAKVRNERLLAGDGRVYHIGFTATDSEGASCTGEVKACVPAKEGEACGDQGALFDSTVCPE